MSTPTASKSRSTGFTRGDLDSSQPQADLRKLLAQELARPKPQIEIPGWTVEVRRGEVARGKGWWQAARDRGANHQGRPLLLYRVGVSAWRAVLALRDVHPDLSDAAPKLNVETDLEGLVAVLERTPTRPPKSARRHRAVIARG